MKKFIVIEVVVIIALVIGFLVGKSLNSDNPINYYRNADRAWQEAVKTDIPPVTLDDFDQKRLQQVRALYREVFDKYPNSDWADDALYQYASRISRSQEEQFTLFRRIINNYPDSQWADDSLYGIAVAYYRLGAEASENNPELQDAGDTYYDRSFAFFDQVIRDYSGSALVDQALFNRAMCYYGKKMLEPALEQLSALTNDLADTLIIHEVIYYIGMIYVEQRKYKNGRVEFRNVIDSGHKELSPLAQFGIAQTYFSEANYEKAIDEYEKVIGNYSATKSAEDARFYIGWSYQRLEKYDEAIFQLEEAIELFPHNENSSNSQFFIAQIYHAKEDYQGATEAYRKVMDNTTIDYNTRRSAQYRIAKLLEENDDIDGAVGAYQQLLKNFPELHQTPSHPSNNINENYIRKLRSDQL